MPVATKSQQTYIIELLMRTSATTIELKEMDILDPTPRINELRHQGFFIITVDQDYTDKNKETHIIGRYVLLQGRSNLNKKGEATLERAMEKRMASGSSWGNAL